MTVVDDEAMMDALRAIVREEMQPGFTSLHRFIDRRLAELSAELHASVELVDMNEARLSQELTQMHQQIAGLVAVPHFASRNSGVELEAVVVATEAAANTIMEAAEAIQDWIAHGGRDPESLQALAHRVNAIFEACSFQDVTGQRVRRAIQHLQQVETMLERFMPRLSAPEGKLEVATERHTVGLAAQGQSDMGQREIDALLNG
jgi:chemotaxis protein CheZ